MSSKQVTADSTEVTDPTQVVRSMTGYGSASKSTVELELNIEIRAVNSRFLDVVFRMPRLYQEYESGLKKLVAQKIPRGRVEIYVNRHAKADNAYDVKVNDTLFSACFKALSTLTDTVGANPEAHRFELANLLLGNRDIFEFREVATDSESEKQLLWECLSAGLNAVVTMREVEGKHLEQEVRQRLKEIDNLRSKIESLRKGVVATYAERLETRITELFGDRELDPVRLHSEVAILAEKADIAEELVRIQSHQTQFFELLQRPSSGRKMEFLLQEFGREFNTIASKSQNAEIQKLVVNAKFELEKIKEQVANIE